MGVRESNLPQWWVTDAKGDVVSPNNPTSAFNQSFTEDDYTQHTYIHYNGRTVARLMKDVVADIVDEFELCILRKPKREELFRILRYALSQQEVSDEE
jgi:hypothetical protein